MRSFRHQSKPQTAVFGLGCLIVLGNLAFWWSLWWVVSPIWIPLAIFVPLIIIVAVVVTVVTIAWHFISKLW